MTVAEFNNRANVNGGCDREIGKWKIIDIHQIPEPMLEQHEVDFYCCDDKKVYLLRLRNRNIEAYHKVDSNNHTTYLIAELPIATLDDKLILKALRKFGVE